MNAYTITQIACGRSQRVTQFLWCLVVEISWRTPEADGSGKAKPT